MLKKKTQRKVQQKARIRKQKTMTASKPPRDSKLGLDDDLPNGQLKGTSGMKLLDYNGEMIPRQVVLSGTNQRRKSAFPILGSESINS